MRDCSAQSGSEFDLSTQIRSQNAPTHNSIKNIWKIVGQGAEYLDQVGFLEVQAPSHPFYISIASIT